MATILVAAYGSRGDIMPLTDIGRRLQGAGHRVVLTSNGELDDEVRACGLEARGISLDLPGIDGDAEPLKAARQLVTPAGFGRLGDSFLDTVADLTPDLVLLSPFTELPGHALAEAHGIPSLGLRLQPLSATRSYPPSLLGAWSAGPAGNLAAGRIAAHAVDGIYGGAVRGFRRRLGLPRRSARSLRKQRTAQGWPILHGYSPSVLPRPADWRVGIDVVGYWWSPTPDSWSPPDELADFLAGGPPPVFVGFGSLMVPEAERERLSRLVREAALASGQRFLVQSGGAGLTVPNDEHTLSIGAAPYDWLFARVSAVVHACGAGTTAAGLRAGVPAVGVPSPGVDQSFWARRLEDLGVSPATLPRPKLTADQLARAVDQAVATAGYRERAQEMATRIAGEDGAGAVVERVEALLNA